MINITGLGPLKIILIILLMACSYTIVKAYLSFAPWVPSRSKDLKRIFQLANLQPNETFYDLGCGDGKIAIYASKNFKAKAIGLELALPLYLICKLRQSFIRRKQLIFKFKDLYQEDLTGADVIYIFGTPKTINLKLKQKLERELKPGARVISYAFLFKDWQPAEINKPASKDIPIYLYKK